MTADLSEGVLFVVEDDLGTAGDGAEAEAVGADISALLLNELDQAGVVDLGADQNHAAAPGLFLVGLAGLELFQGLLQLVHDLVDGAQIGGKTQDVELITGDTRMRFLAEVADGADQTDHLVVLLDRLADGLVGNVDAILLVQGVQHMVGALQHRQIHVGGGVLKGNLHVLMEEVRVVLAHGSQQLHVLNAAVEHGAAVGRDDAVGEVEAALNGALQQGTAGLAQQVRHVERGDVHGAGLRCRQTNGETFAQIQQRFGDVLTGVGHRDAALFLCLLDQLVVRRLQQVFKVD